MGTHFGNSSKCPCNGYKSKVWPYVVFNSAMKRQECPRMVEIIMTNDSSLVRAARTFLGSFLRLSLSKTCVACN